MQTGSTTGWARPAAADVPSGQRTCIVEEPQGLGSCFLTNITTEKAVPIQCHKVSLVALVGLQKNEPLIT